MSSPAPTVLTLPITTTAPANSPIPGARPVVTSSTLTITVDSATQEAITALLTPPAVGTLMTAQQLAAAYGLAGISTLLEAVTILTTPAA